MEIAYIIIKEKQVEFCVNFEEIPTFIIGDNERFQQIFYVLLKLFLLNHLIADDEQHKGTAKKEDEELFEKFNLGCSFSQCLDGNKIIELNFSIKFESNLQNLEELNTKFQECQSLKFQSFKENMGQNLEDLDFFLFNSMMRELGGKYQITFEEKSIMILNLQLAFQNGNEAQFQTKKTTNTTNNQTISQQRGRIQMPNNFSFCRLNSSQNTYIWKRKIQEVKKVMTNSSGIPRWPRKDQQQTLLFSAQNQFKKEEEKAEEKHSICSSQILNKIEEKNELEFQETQRNRQIETEEQEYQNIVVPPKLSLQIYDNDTIYQSLSSGTQTKMLAQPKLKKTNSERPFSSMILKQNIELSQEQEEQQTKFYDDSTKIIKNSFQEFKEAYQQTIYQALRKILIKKYNLEINGEVILSERNKELSYRQNSNSNQFGSQTLASIMKTQEVRNRRNSSKSSFSSTMQNCSLTSPGMKSILQKRIKIEQIPGNLLGNPKTTAPQIINSKSCNILEDFKELKEKEKKARQNRFDVFEGNKKLQALELRLIKIIRRWI